MENAFGAIFTSTEQSIVILAEEWKNQLDVTYYFYFSS